jgi:type IV pilus assembly protein PilV
MKKNLRAFGLVEVLVASIIIAIGLLGAASLQSNSLKNMKNNSLYMIAGLLVDEMVQYIIANPREAEKGSSSMYGHRVNSVTNPSYHTPYISNSCFTSTGCNTWNIAANDIAVWHTRITEALGPGSSGTITFPSGIWYSPFSTLFDQNTPISQYPTRVNYIVTVSYRDATGNIKSVTGTANTPFNPWRAIKNKPAATVLYDPSTPLPADCSWSYLLQMTIFGYTIPYPPKVPDPIVWNSCTGTTSYGMGPAYTVGLTTNAYDPGHLTKAERNQLCSNICGGFGSGNFFQYTGLCACNTSNMYTSSAMN